MAKKNTLPQLTEAKILWYAINHANTLIEDGKEKLSKIDESNELYSQFYDTFVRPFSDEKEMMIKRYELETGNEWQGI